MAQKLVLTGVIAGLLGLSGVFWLIDRAITRAITRAVKGAWSC